MQESACAWRLSIVLREVQYPAQKWMILTTADTYGADDQTRIELEDLPEATYHDIDDVVAAVKNNVGRLVARPQLFRLRGAAIGVVVNQDGYWPAPTFVTGAA
jgi:Protein of unknown function (DUF2795)